MAKLVRAQRILLVYSLFVAISAILILGGMLSSPSEPGSSFLMGLSLPRLVLAAGLLSAFLLFILAALRALRDREWAASSIEKWFGGGRFSEVLALLVSISFALGWIGCFLPSHRVGVLVSYWIRLQPLMIFILLASAATLVVIFIQRSRLVLHDLQFSKTHQATTLAFFVFLLILAVMFSSGFGVRISDDFWYGAGVPILASQLIAVLLAGILFSQIEKRLTGRWRRVDLVIFLLIYIFTAALWMREPIQTSFLFPGPYAPNRVLYPFADSATFDMSSQFALIGQGISNGHASERSLYISFLVYLHSFFGQNYENLMAIQAGLFAVFPGIIYLIGKSLNSRSTGFASAIAATLRGVNSIAASNMIDLANPKMMLTDFPAAIGMALVVLLTCEWLKLPERRAHYALWIGGAIGFSLMLRANPLILLCSIPLYALFRFLPDWKKWLTSSLLIFVGLIAITLPWELRNQARGEMIYNSYLEKLQNVIKQRYISPEPEGLLPQAAALASVSLKHTEALLSSYRSVNSTNVVRCDTVFCFAPNHFLHNIVTSILAVPTSPILDDLRHTVMEDYPYWQSDWDGSFTAVPAFFFVLNVLFIILGIGMAWNQLGMAGLTPLAVFIFYDLSNAFARTSGGRYLVPIDWIILIYFLLGVLHILIWSANRVGMDWQLFSVSSERNTQNATSRNLPNLILILIALFGLGSLVPLSETFQQPRYRNVDATQQLMEHEQALAKAGMSIEDINAFLQTRNAKLLIGRVLYPRYYPIDRGEILLYPFIRMGFPRTAFMLIGPEGSRGIILPGNATKHLPQAVDALVLGCRAKKHLDALAVVILDETGAVYTRSPESGLRCPLKQPVCDDNRVCQ
jgi:hypothetical protein